MFCFLFFCWRGGLWVFMLREKERKSERKSGICVVLNCLKCFEHTVLYNKLPSTSFVRFVGFNDGYNIEGIENTLHYITSHSLSFLPSFLTVCLYNITKLLPFPFFILSFIQKEVLVQKASLSPSLSLSLSLYEGYGYCYCFSPFLCF